MKKLLLLTALVAACTGAFALKNAVKTLQVENWTVLRDVDPMTDAVNCTGIYKGQYTTQLSDAGLYIRVNGGIRGITLRFDDEPPREMRLATKMEKDVRVVILDGADRAKALSSKRLRYQVVTLVSGVVEGELDLAGIEAAAQHIAAKCPLGQPS